MIHRSPTATIIRLVLLICLVFAAAAVPQPAFAAVNPDLVLSITPDSQVVIPGQKVNVQIAQVFPNLSSTKSNIGVDTLVTLVQPEGVNLSGMLVEIYEIKGLTETYLGSLSLASGQTNFWFSNFGGVLGRHPMRKESLKTHTYRLSFLLPQSLTGKQLQMNAEIVGTATKYINDPSRWATSSPVASATFNMAAPALIISGDIAGPYDLHTIREFHVSVSNPTNGYAHDQAQLGFSITNAAAEDIETFEYYDGSTWQPMLFDASGTAGIIGPSGSFAFPTGASLTWTLRISFATPLTYNFRFALNDVARELELASLAVPAIVNPADPLLVSNDLPGPYLAGQPQEFQITAVNPSDGASLIGLVLKLTVANKPANIIHLEAYVPATGAWENMPLTLTAGNAVGTYGLPDGFALAVGSSQTIKFRAVFDVPGTYAFSFQMVETPGGATIAALSQSALVSPVAPTLVSSDLDGPYSMGFIQTFSVQLFNPATGTTYTNAGLHFTFTNTNGDLTSLESSPDGKNWTPMALTANGSETTAVFALGSTIATASNSSYLFRVLFSREAVHQISVVLKDSTNQNISQLLTVQAPVTNPIPELAFDLPVYNADPDNQVVVETTVNFPDYTFLTDQTILVDMLFTLTPPAGANLQGMRVEAYDYSGATEVYIGGITLADGQTSFWASAFTGIFARHPLVDESNQSNVYHFKLTPAAGQANQLIDFQAQVICARAAGFANPSGWSLVSDPVSSDLVIGSLPIPPDTRIFLPMVRR